MSLRIVPVDTKGSHKHPKVKHPVLPQHEFSLLIVAPKGSGKTNLICNLLLNHFKGYFHQVWVCSPTVDNDPKWNVVKETKGILLENKKLKSILEQGIDPKTKKRIPKIVHGAGEPLDEGKKSRWTGELPDDAFITDLQDIIPRLEKQNEVIQHDLKEYGDEAKYLADRILVIMDDQAGLFKGGNVNNPMVNFLLRHRHYNTSVITVTQANKAIPKSMRTNHNALICFEIPNRKELETVMEEWPAEMEDNTWMRVYKHATEEPFSFLYINTHFPKGKRVYKNFDMRYDIGKNRDPPMEGKNRGPPIKDEKSIE